MATAEQMHKRLQVCVTCWADYDRHPRDGMGECRICARQPAVPAWERGRTAP